MALPIKETPVLYGKDALRFLILKEKTDKGLHAVSKEEYDRARKVYDECITAWRV